MSPKFGLMTRKDLAEAFSCDVRTIARWQDEGMPVAERGRGGHASKYSLPAVIAWKAGQADGLAGSMSSRHRKELAQALEAEQRIAIKSKELVSAADIEQLIAGEYARCRTKLLGLSRKLKAEMPHLTITDVGKIDAGIREALKALADGDFS